MEDLLLNVKTVFALKRRTYIKNEVSFFVEVDKCNSTNKKKGNSQGSHTADRWRKEENNNRKISQITRMQKTLPVIKWTRWKPDNLGKIMQLWEQKTVSVELWMHPGASSYLLFMQITWLSKLIISRLRLISFLYFVDHAAHRTWSPKPRLSGK